MTRYGPTGGDGGGVVVEVDEELKPLPDDERVPDSVQQPPVANDTIEPQAMDDLAIVPDADADGETAPKDASQPVRSRLPMPALVGLAGLVGVAGVAGTAWALRRRRTMHPSTP